MLGNKSLDFQVARGAIEDVFYEEEIGVFCSVRLRHYTGPTGIGLVATCRLAVPYHGKDYGDWWTPEIGTEVIVAFPGIGMEGSPGADLDDGYVVGFTSNKKVPPQPTTDTLRILKGKAGEDRAEEIRGSHSFAVEKGRTIVIGEFEDRTVGEGRITDIAQDDIKTVGGKLDVSIDGESSWFSQMLMRIRTAAELFITGTISVNIDSGVAIVLTAPTITIGTTGSIVTIAGKEFLTHKHGGVAGGIQETTGVV